MEGGENKEVFGFLIQSELLNFAAEDEFYFYPLHLKDDNLYQKIVAIRGGDIIGSQKEMKLVDEIGKYYNEGKPMFVLKEDNHSNLEFINFYYLYLKCKCRRKVSEINANDVFIFDNNELDKTKFVKCIDNLTDMNCKKLGMDKQRIINNVRDLKEEFYIEKVKVPSTSKVIIFGDIHGSFHTFFRCLIRFHLLGIIDLDSFKMKEEYYLMFLGDVIDRGTYGLEIVYLISLLKEKNYDRVFYNRGNHEEGITSIGMGKQSLQSHIIEYLKKMGIDDRNKGIEMFTKLMTYFNTNSSGIILEYNNKRFWLSHGGLPINTESVSIINELKRFIDDSKQTILYPKETKEYMYNFMNQLRWNDYISKDEEGRCYTIKEEDLKKVLSDYGIDNIIRGHQDNYYNFYLQTGDKRVDIIKENHDNVLKINEKGVDIKGRLLFDTNVPVLTISTNNDIGRELLTDSFLIISDEKGLELNVKEEKYLDKLNNELMKIVELEFDWRDVMRYYLTYISKEDVIKNVMEKIKRREKEFMKKLIDFIITKPVRLRETICLLNITMSLVAKKEIPIEYLLKNFKTMREIDRYVYKTICLCLYYNLGNIDDYSTIIDKLYNYEEKRNGLKEYIEEYVTFEKINNQKEILEKVIGIYRNNEKRVLSKEQKEMIPYEGKEIDTYIIDGIKVDLLKDPEYMFFDDVGRLYISANIYENDKFVMPIVYYTSLSEGFIFRYYLPYLENKNMNEGAIIRERIMENVKDNLEYSPLYFGKGNYIIKSPIDYVGVNLVNYKLQNALIKTYYKMIETDIQIKLNVNLNSTQNKEEINYLVMGNPRMYNNLLLEAISQNNLFPSGGFRKSLEIGTMNECYNVINETNILTSSNFTLDNETIEFVNYYEYIIMDSYDTGVKMFIFRVKMKENKTEMMYNVYLKVYKIEGKDFDKNMEIDINKWYINVNEIIPEKGDRINKFGLSDVYIKTNSAWFYKIFEYDNQVYDYLKSRLRRGEKSTLINDVYLFVGDIYDKIWPCNDKKLRERIYSKIEKKK